MGHFIRGGIGLILAISVGTGCASARTTVKKTGQGLASAGTKIVETGQGAGEGIVQAFSQLPDKLQRMDEWMQENFW